MNEQNDPIIILGAARSGTTVLGKTFRSHPDILYIEEPNYIWKHGYAYLGHDVLAKKHATEKQKRYIHSRFNSLLSKSGKLRIVEKTPANCLRLEYIHQIYPNAKYIHIVRDGRMVALSAYKKSLCNIEHITSINTDIKTNRFNDIKNTIKRRIQIGGLTPIDLIFLTPHLWHSVLNMLGVKRYKLWGPKFLGMKEASKIFSQIEIAALQWKVSVESAKNYINTSSIDCIEIFYENLMRNPIGEIKRIFDFVNLCLTTEVLTYIKENIAHDFSNTTPTYSHNDIKIIEKHIYSTLKMYNYL